MTTPASIRDPRSLFGVPASSSITASCDRFASQSVDNIQRADGYIDNRLPASDLQTADFHLNRRRLQPKKLYLQGTAMANLTAQSTNNTAWDGVSIESLLDSARELRAELLENQADVEREGPSAEIFRKFVDAGFYRLLTPKMFGGFQLSQEDFYRLIMEIGRGCPSTSWWYALGAGHSLQVASFLEEPLQRELFELAPDFSAPWSRTRTIATIVPDGPDGYRVTGDFRYSSGVIHAPVFMGMVPFTKETRPIHMSPAQHPSDERGMATIFVPAGQYTILDDWRTVFGMKGSGSNTVRIENVFVPKRFVVMCDRAAPYLGHTPGSKLHGSDLYGGRKDASLYGSLAAIAVGTGLAAIDEAIAAGAGRPSVRPPGIKKSQHPDYQRAIGSAVANMEAARGIVLSGARLYREFARNAINGVEPFVDTKAQLMSAMFKRAEELAYKTIFDLAMVVNTSALRDGQRLQRYYRDISTMVTRDGAANETAFGAAHLKSLGLEVSWPST